MALFCGLGYWQLGRSVEKEEQIAQFLKRGTLSALKLTKELSLTKLPELEFRSAVVRGHYLQGRQFLLDNRTHSGVAGYHVLTPLRLSSTEVVVLVNRGWIPAGGDRSASSLTEAPGGEHKLKGLLVLPREDLLVLGQTGYERPIHWPIIIQRVEIQAISKCLGKSVLPVIFALGAREKNGFLREWTPYIGITPERHHGYAFQWFSLAVAVGVVWIFFIRRRLIENKNG